MRSVIPAALVLALIAWAGCGPPVRSARRPPPRDTRPAEDPPPSRTTTDRQPPIRVVEPAPAAKKRKTKKRRRARRPSRIIVRRCKELLPDIETVAGEHDVDVGVLVGLIRLESGFRPDARNRSGASGLMQVMPGTARRFKCGRLWDVRDNLQCGVRVLKRYLARYDGNLTYGLAAYHAGPKYPDRAWKAGRLPDNLRYVEKVLAVRTRFLRYGCDFAPPRR